MTFVKLQLCNKKKQQMGIKNNCFCCQMPTIGQNIGFSCKMTTFIVKWL